MKMQSDAEDFGLSPAPSLDAALGLAEFRDKIQRAYFELIRVHRGVTHIAAETAVLMAVGIMLGEQKSDVDPFSLHRFEKMATRVAEATQGYTKEHGLNGGER